MGMGADFVQGQRLDRGRYAVIPRTLSFLTRPGQVLLCKLADDRGTWAGLYNGIGGHIERGEDPLSAARREILEETGLQPEDLLLCGVVTVDASEQAGIALYVFVGKVESGSLTSTSEGTPEWVDDKRVGELPLVEDVPFLLQQSMHAFLRKRPFSAAYRSSQSGKLEIRLAEG